nr:hypothetical protein [Pseudodesulfovibrio sp.]
MINEIIETLYTLIVIAIMAILKLTIVDLLPFFVSITALVTSIIALFFTIRQFNLKKGIEARSTYTLMYSNDVYISNLILENRKDKPMVIFKIYMKVGNNNYIEIENFENNPLLIKPFETYVKNYEPIIEYKQGFNRIKINSLLKDSKNIKLNTVLYTTEGEYIVKTYVKREEISINKTIITMARLPYKNVSYGENIKYLIDFTLWNDKSQVIALNQDAYMLGYDFNLTQELMKSKQVLENHMKNYINENEYYKNVIVIDFEQKIKNKNINNPFYSPIIEKAINKSKYELIKNELKFKMTSYFGKYFK